MNTTVLRDLHAQHQFASTARTPETSLDESEDAEHLRLAIGRLEGMQRAVLVLYHYEALQPREIALVLDLSESQIACICTQAITKLRAEHRDRLHRRAA